MMGIFRSLILSLLIFAVLMGPAYLWADDDLKTIEQKAQYLGYMRRNYPSLYNDFVVRTDAIDFLERANEAINQLHFNGNHISGFDLSVHQQASSEFESGQFDLADLDLDKFKNILQQFILTHSDSKRTVRGALEKDLLTASRLDGLTAGLMQSQNASQFREIFQRPSKDQFRDLTIALTGLPKISGLDPARIGLSQESISGAEFLKLYQEALQAQQNSFHLIFLETFAQAHAGSTQLRIDQMSKIVASCNPQEFMNLFSLESFRTHSALIATQISQRSGSAFLNVSKIAKIFKAAHNQMRTIVMTKAQTQEQTVLTIKRAHPYELFLRGSVGDCATDKSFALSLASKEEIYWLYGSKNKNEVKGYLQFTRVITDGEPSLYVNTISGADISRRDTRRALLALFDSLKELKATRIVIPVSEKIPQIINYPEVAVVLEEMNKVGRKVELHYQDTQDRMNLAPFTDGSLDLPETNKFGIEIKRENVALPNISTTLKKSESLLRDILAPLNREEVLMIALDLRNRETNSLGLQKLLQKHGLSNEIFENLWEALSNKDQAPIDLFHRRLQNKIIELGINIEWNKFKHSPILFRGHFAAPDALYGTNSELGLAYLRTYLMSLSGIEEVYQTLTPHYSELLKQQEFVAMVKSLFKKNTYEMGRILDFYELDEKSAYRTLANLFGTGLSAAAFESEIQSLAKPSDHSVETLERLHGINIRRISLLGMIYKYEEQYFTALTKELESIAASGASLADDDIRLAAQYFASYAEVGGASKKNIQRMNSFLMNSKLGLRFALDLGMFKIDKLNIPAYFATLIKAGQPSLAAHLIHKDPWPSHPLASRWLSDLWIYKEHIGHSALIEGLMVTPSWQKVEGTDRLIDWLVPQALTNLGDESHMTTILLRQPNKLTPARLKWLSQVSTRELAHEILEAINDNWPVAKAKWLKAEIEKNYSEFNHSNSLAAGTRYRCEALFK